MTPPPERLAAALSGRYAIERELLPLFDSGEADGFLFFVTPYIEGETVRDRLERDTQLAVEEAVAIAADVADALDPAHGQGVIHRDLKPANILLRDGRPLQRTSRAQPDGADHQLVRRAETTDGGGAVSARRAPW